MSASPSKSRSTLPKIILAAAAVALAVLGGTALVVGYAARSVDQLQAEKEKALVERSLQRSLTRMRENVVSATIWSEAYLKTAGDFDQTWAQINYGDYFADYMDQEVSLAYDHDDRLVYASRDSEPVAPASEAELARAVAPMVASVRAGSARQRPDARGHRPVGFAAVVTREGVVRAGDQFYLVAVSTAVPEDLASARFHTPDPIVVSARALPGFLKAASEDLLIAQPQLLAADAAATTPSVLLRGPDGAALARISWRPDRPGLYLLGRAQLFIALIALMVLAAGFLLMLRVMASLRALDENEAKLGATLQALTTARDLAEAGNQAKSQFLANMSHELRTPLNAVIALSELLGARQGSGEDREMASLIATSGRTLERVVNDILDVSKIEGGHVVLDHMPFDLMHCLEQVFDLHAVAASAKGLQLVRDIDPALAGGVMGDADRITQVVSNLLSNAVKFTESGSIRLTARRRGGRVSISVADSGIGFDAAARTRLFQRFEQADQTITRRFGGTGLGLSISCALAEMMGGSIAVRSTPGKGSVFLLNLPFEPAPAMAVVRASEAPFEAAQAPVPGRALRILLAEDHPTNQRVVALILEPLGVQLTIVGDGVSALELARAGGFDLILMDVQMPEMDGLTATRLLREYEMATGMPRTPIVSLTANAMVEHVAASMAAGSDRHLGKPVRPAALVAVVMELAPADDQAAQVNAA